MKKIVSFVLSAVLAIGVITINTAVFAAIYTQPITSAKLASNMSSSNFSVASGNYESDGYISKLTTTKFTSSSETDKAIYVTLPSEIWDYDPNAITIKVKIGDSDEYCAGQAIARFTSVTSIAAWKPDANDVNLLSGDGKWFTIKAGEVKSIRCDLTSDQFAAVKERKMTKLLFPNGARSNCHVTEFTLVSLEVEYGAEGNEVYSVNLDGEKIGDVERGLSYTMPNPDNVVAYKDEAGNLYPSGHKFTYVLDDISLTSVKLDVKMLNGAQMRLTDVSGLRFLTSVPISQLDELTALGFEIIEKGTIIAKESVVGENRPDNITFETRTVYTDDSSFFDAIDVKYEEGVGFYNENDNGNKIFTGAIVDIKEENANLMFFGRGYITLSNGDITRTIYADVSDISGARSVSFVSKACKADYKYDGFSNDKKAVVDKYAELYKAPPAKKYIALTYDDGPNTKNCPKILDKLNSMGMKATFMLIGKNITESTRPVVQRMLDEGYEIENHGYTAEQMGSWTAEQVLEDRQKMFDLFAEFGQTPKFFRAPGLNKSGTLINSMDLPLLEGISTNDWRTGSVSVQDIIDTIYSGKKDGEIILLHTLDYDNFADREIAVLNEIVPTLREEGYEFVTVSELFEKAGVEPVNRKIYNNVYD
ncbi:MAG: polysaccharide deacetylase family protein [Acutalibacteraceae bacterium]